MTDQELDEAAQRVIAQVAEMLAAVPLAVRQATPDGAGRVVARMRRAVALLVGEHEPELMAMLERCRAIREAEGG